MSEDILVASFVEEARLFIENSRFVAFVFEDWLVASFKVFLF